MATANPNQHRYLEDLARKAGLSTEEAIRQSLGRPVPVEKLTVRQASLLIFQLRGRLGEGQGQAAPSDDGGANAIEKLLAPATMPLSAATVRAIHSGRQERPEQVDADTAWILDRLSEADRLERQAARRRGAGLNRGGPIEMAALVKHFGSWDRLAEVFGVTVPTAKAWGAHLPAARAFEAEVKTDGLVRAPR